MAYTVYIRGIPENKLIKAVNVRSAPGISNSTVLFQTPIDATATCTEVKADPVGDRFQGQVYKWFHLTFSDGRTGWVRDDLLDLQGDCSPFGYGSYDARTFAFTAGAALATKKTATVTVTQVPATASQPAATTVTIMQPDAAGQPVATTVTITQTMTAVTTDQPATPAVTVTVSQQPTVPDCDAAVRRDTSANVRAMPSVTSAKVDNLKPGTTFRVLGVEQGQDGQPFRWMKLTTPAGATGYIREDLLTFSGDCSAWGIATADAQPAATSTTIQPVQPATAPSSGLNTQNKFPCPINVGYGIFQEYNGMRFGSPHKGCDLSFPAKEGTPIIASGTGVVTRAMTCTRCTPDKPNFRSQGLADWDTNAINDPAWGYGYGNHVIVRYAWADLPANMRNVLTGLNLANGYAYVIYAHLSRIDVTENAVVSAKTPIGLLGNTGNSTGAHLHLEVRLSLLANDRTLFSRLTVNPREMFEI
ncbi:MAG: peptidoglycan DD-metalloendopeptidase family protein [Anaerolineae bacterium]|nr:peptidoglycan DD-metalloendopeptidase family protein [Anaerolineae bacterium]